MSRGAQILIPDCPTDEKRRRGRILVPLVEEMGGNIRPATDQGLSFDLVSVECRALLNEVATDQFKPFFEVFRTAVVVSEVARQVSYLQILIAVGRVFTVFAIR
jgi:hypothetical protein